MPLSRTTAERIPEPLRNALWPLYACALTCGNGPIPLVLLRGTTPSGRQGSLLLAGADPQVNYFARRFFSGTPRRELLAETPVWNLESALGPWQERADLTIAVLDRLSTRIFLRRRYLVLPQWVRGRMTMPTQPEALAGLNRSLASDLRRLRRGQYKSEISTNDSDFDLFYGKFYEPFVRLRHTEAVVLQTPELLRSHFREGAILWLTRHGERLAGCLFAIRDHTMFLLESGLRNGALDLLKSGVVSSIYIHLFDHARRQGCTSLDFGGSRPCLHDGVLRYKRKWGIHLMEKHRRHPDFFVRWSRWTPGLAEFLAGTSLIYRDHGAFSAVTALLASGPATQADADRLHHLLWTNGLQRLSIVSPSGWLPDLIPPPQTALIASPLSLTDLIRI